MATATFHPRLAGSAAAAGREARMRSDEVLNDKVTTCSGLARLEDKRLMCRRPGYKAPGG